MKKERSLVKHTNKVELTERLTKYERKARNQGKARYYIRGLLSVAAVSGLREIL